MKKQSDLKKEKLGKISIVRHENGSITIYDGNITRSAMNPEKVKEKAEREMRRKGRVSSATYNQIKNLGYLNLEDQRRSIESGANYLCIEVGGRARKNLFQRRVDRDFRSFWRAKDVGKFERDQIGYALPTINDFRKRFPSNYKWIKENGGMLRFMEERRPGLYRLISRRINGIALDVRALGQELTRAINSGVPVSKSYLKKRDKRIYRHVQYALAHRMLPERCGTFNEALAYLTQRTNSELNNALIGVKQCGKLGEDFVKFYFVWASRAAHDPLELRLPDLYDISFEETRFEYNGGKAWADGRIGNRPVEVKVGTLYWKKEDSAELIEKYASGNHWADGVHMSDAILVLHQEPRFYEDHLGKIKKAGIRVIEFDQFHKAFRSLFETVRDKYPQIIRDSVPHINFDALVDAHNNLNLEKRLKTFARPEFETQRTWYRDMLGYLAQAGEY